MNTRITVSTIAFLTLVLALTGCGGGGGGSTSAGGGAVVPPLQITTTSIISGTLVNTPYSATLSATGGRAPLKWSISPVSPSTTFASGLAINESTGVISGSASWGLGTAGFVALVTDADSRSTSKTFNITAYAPLTAGGSKSVSARQFQEAFGLTLDFQGGVKPLSVTVNGGALPTGMRVNAAGQITGSPITAGNFVASVTIKDSFSPPEVITQQLAIQVLPDFLRVAGVLPRSVPANVPFRGTFFAYGGVPPYTWSLAGGNLPQGLTLDRATGVVSGVPTLSSQFYSVTVTDSSEPPITSLGVWGNMNVDPAKGRNDSPQTATPADNHFGLQASISPYIDPPNKAPLPGDTDYYKLVSLPGGTVHLEAVVAQYSGGNPLDPVLEIVDANGFRLSNCRQPGDTGTNFTSECINDDKSSATHDSALDFLVPGAPSIPTAFYAHVLDWRGDARPDMDYVLQVAGIVPPLSIQPSLRPIYRDSPYTLQLNPGNGTGPFTFSENGSLPPGISMNSTGKLSGLPTTNGSYPFTVHLVDSSTPPQQVTIDYTLEVVDPLVFTSSGTMPDACVNQPYSFTFAVSGGAPPRSWFLSNTFPSPYNFYNGTFTAAPVSTGSYTGRISVYDRAGIWVEQDLTLTVKNCT